MTGPDLSTSDLLAMGAARIDRVGVLAVAPGDITALCVNAKGDVWVLFPVAEVEGGVVTQVLDGDGVAAHWFQIAESDDIVAMPRAWFHADGLRVLVWKPFIGLARLREALAAILLERRH